MIHVNDSCQWKKCMKLGSRKIVVYLQNCETNFGHSEAQWPKFPSMRRQLRALEPPAAVVVLGRFQIFFQICVWQFHYYFFLNLGLSLERTSMNPLMTKTNSLWRLKHQIWNLLGQEQPRETRKGRKASSFRGLATHPSKVERPLIEIYFHAQLGANRCRLMESSRALA